MFWKNKWFCTRMAGSGSMPFPCPDLLSGKNGRVLAIECKSGKKTRYIEKRQIQELLEFSRGFGAEPWIGVRFNNLGWRFLKPKDLTKSGKSFSVSKDRAIKKGLTFKELIE